MTWRRSHLFPALTLNPSTVDILVEDQEVNSKRVWRQLQALVNFFWRRFITEYIPNQTKRKKWTVTSQNIKVGDLVLLADSKQPHGSWPLGRVTGVHPADEIVRVVTVRTPTGEYKRSVTRLCLLEDVDKNVGCLGNASTGGGDVPTYADGITSGN